MASPEEIARMISEDIDARDQTANSLKTALQNQKLYLGTAIPKLREIALYGFPKRHVDDGQKRFHDELVAIANALAKMQSELHGQDERKSGQLWTDVENRPSLY